ncbi:hypothetical protein ACFQ3W_00460 [Paenibacillus puldeungensis]|uniref:Tyr recombinase domain-containing protein n=2 Tax=Paenibacillus puldeungensis TaxID=696536 RepID=A0ABW3RR25_9BACL
MNLALNSAKRNRQRGKNSWELTVSLGRGVDEKYIRRKIQIRSRGWELHITLKAYIQPICGVMERKIRRQAARRKTLNTYLINMNTRILPAFWKLTARSNKDNPAAEMKKPKVVHKEIISYDEKEIRAMLQALQKVPYHWRIMITLALTTRMRRGELLRLKF